MPKVNGLQFWILRLPGGIVGVLLLLIYMVVATLLLPTISFCMVGRWSDGWRVVRGLWKDGLEGFRKPENG